MIKALSIEFYKIRHRKIGLTMIIIMAAQFILAAYSIVRMKPYELVQGWMGAMSLFSEINCLFMPITVAVIASRLSDIEHKGNMFKLLKAIMPSSRLVIAKFLCGAIYIIIATILQMCFVILMGNLKGFMQEFPTMYFVYYFLCNLMISLTLLLLQFIISLQFVNQMISFVVAITGTLLGVFSMFIGSISKFVLWGYYLELAPLRMNWSKETRIIDYYWIDIPVGEIMVLLLVFAILFIIAKKFFEGKGI